LLAPQGELDQKLKAGQAFLIRLGRYGGADNKTLTGEGVASIKIMGAKGEKPTFEPTTKTVWLAAQYDTDQKHLIPFGWAVVEIDPQADCTSLQNWCATQAAGRPNMAAKRAELQAERQAAIAQKVQHAVEAAQRTAAAEAERLAAEQRAQALLQMSSQAQQVETLRQACEDLANKLPPHGNFKKQAPEPNKPGLYKDAVALVKIALESPDWSATDKATLANMLEAWLPKAISPWDAKEQRKKFVLSKLRANS
jgi:CRISPR-associated protein Csm5